MLRALRELRVALDENERAADCIRERARAIEEARAAGKRYTDIVSADARPLVVELVSETLDRLMKAGSRLRRAEAAALHGEGLSMEAIAEVFGVSRQRVSALLRPPKRPDGPAASEGPRR